MEKELVLSQGFVMDSLVNPNLFDQLQRSANLFSKSGLVPATFKDNVAACFVGLQLACGLGCNPFMLFQGLYSISGKIGIETKVAVAIANEKGVFTGPITHEFKGEGKTRSCTATATLAKSGKTVSLTVDWATVEAEGWNKRQGSKWLTMPDQMFRYRSSMWLIRTYAPEVLMGLNSTDELEDSKIIDITPKKVKKIDEVFVKETPVEQPKVIETAPAVVETKAEVKAEVQSQPAAETVPEVKDWDKLLELRRNIDSYGIPKQFMTVYIVKSIGQNIPYEDLREEDLTKLYDYIVKIKGAK